MRQRFSASWRSIAFAFCAGGLAGLILAGRREKPGEKGADVPAAPGSFEWGETPETDAFFDRHPGFYPAFERLIAVSNKGFARPLPTPYYGPDYTLFSLGQSCRQDYMEILFLASHGYGTGASKLLRGLYERALALAYMVRSRDKVQCFCDFAAVRENKAMKDALKVTSEEQWIAARGADYAPQKVRERYESVREQFLQTDCKKCGTQRLAISWDLDIASMVTKVGEPYATYYLGAYANANLAVHATATSALRSSEKDQPRGLADQRAEADMALFSASMLFADVLRSQNTLMSLALDHEIQECENAIALVWKQAIDARTGV